MHFYPTERIALFIDGANLYATAKALGFDIDYKRLLTMFRSKGLLVRALYYTALAEEQEYSSIRPLIDWLDYNGYTMVTKPTKEFTDASGRRKLKGNMDIELAIDVMEMAEHLDHVVIFSGDGDFRRLVEAVQRNGRRVTVVSTVRSQPPMVADELRRQQGVFNPFEFIEARYVARILGVALGELGLVFGRTQQQGGVLQAMVFIQIGADRNETRCFDVRDRTRDIEATGLHQRIIAKHRIAVARLVEVVGGIGITYGAENAKRGYKPARLADLIAAYRHETKLWAEYPLTE